MCGKTPRGLRIDSFLMQIVFWRTCFMAHVLAEEKSAVSITTLKTKNFVQQVVLMIILSFSNRSTGF